MSTQQPVKIDSLSALESYNINAIEIAKSIFATLVFLSTYSLIFDFIQNREQLNTESVTDTTVKDAQKKSLYLSFIPTIIAAFMFINTIGIIILILVFCGKFFFVNS